MPTQRLFQLSLFASVAALAALAVMSGCKPDYPSCETDKDCKDKEFCVGRKCQLCRDSKDCGPGQACNAGKCDPIPGYCRNKSECPAGQECIANQCKPCASHGDCPSGTYCVKGACSSKKPCKVEDDCAQNEDCVQGVCVAAVHPPAPPPKECTLEAVFFDFNESALTTEATSRLAQDADCLKKVNRAATLVGHTDTRGTQEYNLALSERRAQSVRDHLGRLGVDGTKLTILPRGSLDAKGTDEPTWAQDRRVDFTWR